MIDWSINTLTDYNAIIIQLESIEAHVTPTKTDILKNPIIPKRPKKNYENAQGKDAEKSEMTLNYLRSNTDLIKSNHVTHIICTVK